MKKIIFSLLTLLMATTAMAQEQLFQPDPAVRKGKLKNGLTYYIRHNEEPKERAYFYIAQKVGAIQEDPNQRGLAHFLEHMCFNGTKHFPGDSLRVYLEKIGVKFGADLNAYTAVDETVYNIDNVPTKVDGAIDNCLLILHDWSHDLLLEGDEIDKERGVIQEEWRSRNSASQRMNERMMPVLMAGSKYADCMPIGSMDIVMHFDHQALRDYYQKWYRPDLQGIVVVGDIDVDQVEKKIKKVFADIPKPKKGAAERVYYPVPDNQELIYFSGTDKETTSPSVIFYFKHDATPRDQKNTRQAQLNALYANFVYGMFHDHTRDIAQKPNAPFALAYIRDGGFFLSQTKRALSAIVSCHAEKGGVERGTEALLRELFRVRKHGFTQSEFDRYRHDMLVSLDNQLKNKDKRQSKRYVNEYVRHFLDNDPYTVIDDEVAFWKEELPKLTVDDLNRWFRSIFRENGSNMAVSVTGPENDSIKMPTKEQLMAIYNKVAAEAIEPYVDNVNNLPFLPVEPVPGQIVKETTDADGLVHMELSNGVKVIVKKTDFRKDQILMQAMAHGGSSLFPADMYKYTQLISMMTQVSGWGNYNLADMEKKFTGKTASVNGGIAENYQSVAGSCDAKDIKTLLEKAHAAFLYPHKDSDAFQALVDRLKRNMRESKGKPNRVFADSLRFTLYGDNPYAAELEKEDYDKVDYDSLLALYKERFADASNFTFTFVGDVNLDSLRPYLCQYIASLPATNKHEEAKPVLTILPGSRQCVFDKEQETPKATIAMYYLAPGKFNRRSQIVGSMLGQVLTILYTKTIREDAGAAYSVQAAASVNYYPEEQERIVVRFPTDPKNRDLAIRLVDEGIEQIAKEGPATAEIDKVKEYLIKVCQGNREVNQYWQYVLSYEWNHPGEKYDDGYIEMVRSITPKEVQDMARHLKEQGDRILVVMSTPEKK
ncbi:MAG: insulinase family protein [Prevotella sp.]|nr:insulinase family protein [Prevotella sp.]